jgi:prepilin-type processing-associated H-X9-DG protein
LGAYTDGKPTKPSNVIKPSECIGLADSNWDLSKNGDSDWSGFIGMYAERQWPLDLHSGRANVLFLDNHVQALKRKKFVSQQNTETDDKQEANRIWNIDNNVH